MACPPPRCAAPSRATRLTLSRSAVPHVGTARTLRGGGGDLEELDGSARQGDRSLISASGASPRRLWREQDLFSSQSATRRDRDAQDGLGRPMFCLAVLGCPRPVSCPRFERCAERLLQPKRSSKTLRQGRGQQRKQRGVCFRFRETVSDGNECWLGLYRALLTPLADPLSVHPSGLDWLHVNSLSLIAVFLRLLIPITHLPELDTKK